jgi:hypothetical protein
MIEILVKLVDALLGGLVSKWRDRKALVSELETLKRRVLYVGVTNNLPVELHRLRSFLINHGLVERPGVQRFLPDGSMRPLLLWAHPVSMRFRARR